MLKIDVSEIIQLGKDVGEIAGPVMSENLKRGAYVAGSIVQKEARSLVAVDTGALKISIDNSADDSSGKLVQTVGPNQPYGKDIEFGRPPGTIVSPAALMGWAKRKGLNPYAVAKSIQKKGSPAQPFLFPALENSEDNIVKVLAQAVESGLKMIFARNHA